MDLELQTTPSALPSSQLTHWKERSLIHQGSAAQTTGNILIDNAQPMKKPNNVHASDHL